MKVLQDYAKKHNINYKDLYNDFMDSSESEREDFLYQIGGNVQQQESNNQGEQIVQFIQQSLQQGQKPEQVLQALVENGIPQEQATSIIQEVMAQMEQVETPQQEQAEPTQEPNEMQSYVDRLRAKGIPDEDIKASLEQQGYTDEEMMQVGGLVPINPRGYYELDPRKNGKALIPTPDGSITMKGLNFDINAFDGHTGEFLKTMKPNKDYKFNTNLVLEEPVYAQAGTGNQIAEIEKFLQNQKNIKKKFKDVQEQISYERNLMDQNLLLTEAKRIQERLATTNYESEEQKLRPRLTKILSMIKGTMSPYKKDTEYIWDNKSKQFTEIQNNQNVPNVKQTPNFNLPKNAKLDQEITSFGKTNKIYTTPDGGRFSVDENNNVTNISSTKPKQPTLNTEVNVGTNSGNPFKRASSTKTPFVELGDKTEWIKEWEQYLMNENILPNEQTYTVDQIDDFVTDFVKKNKNLYTDNPYINSNFESLLKDGKYGKVHSSFRPPKGLRGVGTNDPINPLAPKQIDTSTNPNKLASLVIPNDKTTLKDITKPDTEKTFKQGKVQKWLDKTNNFLKENKEGFNFKVGDLGSSLLNTANVVAAYSDTPAVVRRHLNTEFQETHRIALNTVLQPLVEQQRLVTQNINPNSTTGASILANLNGQFLAKTQEVANQVAQENLKIDALNRQAENNLRFTLDQNNMKLDQAGVLEHQENDAMRQASIALANKAVADNLKEQSDARNQIEYMKFNNRGLVNDNSSFFDRLTGTYRLGLTPLELEKLKTTPGSSTVTIDDLMKAIQNLGKPEKANKTEKAIPS